MYIENKNLFPYKEAFVVTLGVLFLFFFWYGSASAATLGVTASDTTLSPGETATLRLVVNTEGVAINNVEAKLSFPSDVIEVISTSKAGSILSLWVEDVSFSNSAGIITFNGGILTPGYIGNQGHIVSVVVKAKKAGRAEFVFSNTAVRANDGLGTNVPTSQTGAILTVVEAATVPPPAAPVPTVTPAGTINLALHSSTHPDQTKWYANNTPEFSWNLPAGALEVRTLIGKNPTATPSVSYIPAISEKKIDELPDGTYYFSLQVRTAEGWGAVSRYRINIDTTSPKPFSVTFPHGNTGWEPQPVVYFNTTDGESGVSHYDIKIGSDAKPVKSAPLADSNPYVLPPQLPGTYTLLVTAVDNAGNIRNGTAEFTIEAIDAPVITYYPETLEGGDILKVRGTTHPNSDVYLYIREGDTLVSEEYSRSNANGDFAIVVTKKLDSGVYAVTARVKDERGAQSAETAPLAVMVQSELVAGIINFVLKYLSAAIIILLALGSIAWVGARLWFKIPRTIARMRREAREAEKTSERAFKVLRDGVERHVARLKKTSRKLTKEETEFLEEFEDKLGEAEELITKEIRDISES